MDVREKIVELLSAYCAVPNAPDAPLEIDSLSLLQLIEELEVAFGFSVRASEATSENFGSLTRIVAFVESKRS